MPLITATVNAHEVGLVTDDALVAGTFRHYTLTAVFDSCWDGLAKRVSFTNGRVTVPMDYVDGMYVPDDVMFAGSLEIGFTGVRQDGVEVIRTMKVVGLDIARSQRDLSRAQVDKAIDVVEKARQRLDDLDAEIPKITEDYLNTKDRWNREIDDATKTSIAQTNASKASEEQRQQTFSSNMTKWGSDVDASTARADAAADSIRQRAEAGEFNGAAFSIKYERESLSGIQAIADAAEGDFAIIIGSDKMADDYGKLYTFNGSAWHMVTDMSVPGPAIKGDKGDKGVSVTGASLSGSNLVIQTTDPSTGSTAVHDAGSLADVAAPVVTAQLDSRILVMDQAEYDALTEYAAGVVYLVRH